MAKSFEEALRDAHAWKMEAPSRFTKEVEGSVADCARPLDVLETAIFEVYAEAYGQEESLPAIPAGMRTVAGLSLIFVTVACNTLAKKTWQRDAREVLGNVRLAAPKSVSTVTVSQKPERPEEPEVDLKKAVRELSLKVETLEREKVEVKKRSIARCPTCTLTKSNCICSSVAVTTKRVVQTPSPDPSPPPKRSRRVQPTAEEEPEEEDEDSDSEESEEDEEEEDDDEIETIATTHDEDVKIRRCKTVASLREPGILLDFKYFKTLIQIHGSVNVLTAWDNYYGKQVRQKELQHLLEILTCAAELAITNVDTCTSVAKKLFIIVRTRSEFWRSSADLSLEAAEALEVTLKNTQLPKELRIAREKAQKVQDERDRTRRTTSNTASTSKKSKKKKDSQINKKDERTSTTAPASTTKP